MKKLVIHVILLALTAPLLHGQGEIDEQGGMLFQDESSFGVFLNSNGFGVNYRYGFWRNARNRFILDGDLTYVKHPKEVKVQAPYSYNTRRYVFGKQNLFWELKGLAGWQRELYRKHDRTGIAVRMYYSGGLSLGFLKPIYYQIYTISPIGEAESYEYLKFDPAIHQNLIGGRGPFFMGFDELGLVPGLTAKTGMSFEYSERNVVIHALEAGIGITAYPRKIPIMATEKNTFLFFNLSVGYRFGTVIDISEAARAKTLKEKWQERKARKAEAEQPLF